MFTILKVRDGLTSYTDPGWYQHPKSTVAEPVDINYSVDEMSNESNQESHISWFSQEENRKESKNTDKNWMQSSPEDSMGGHMHHQPH